MLQGKPRSRSTGGKDRGSGSKKGLNAEEGKLWKKVGSVGGAHCNNIQSMEREGGKKRNFPKKEGANQRRRRS